MEKAVSLEGRGIIPCPNNVGEVHFYKGPPLAAPDLMVLLARAMGRHAQLGIAIDNLRRILQEERLLQEEPPALPQVILDEVRQALDLAQSVVPGIHREVLSRVTHALERIDAYEDSLPPRGQA